jgi:hypothetical protein
MVTNLLHLASVNVNNITAEARIAVLESFI